MPTIGHLLRERREPFISLEFFPPSDPAQLPAFYETAERLQALKPLLAQAAASSKIPLPSRRIWCGAAFTSWRI